MDDIDERFNSSDLEFSPPKPLYLHAGENSIASMRETLLEERRDSEKRVRSLSSHTDHPHHQRDIMERIADQAAALRRHLGLSEQHRMPKRSKHDGGDAAGSETSVQEPLFFVESAPNACRLPTCKQTACGELIEPGTYRIAVLPGMGSEWYSSKTCGTSQDQYMPCDDFRISDRLIFDLFSQIFTI